MVLAQGWFFVPPHPYPFRSLRLVRLFFAMFFNNLFVLQTSVVLVLGVPYVLAVNDWDTACLSGSCTYEAGDGVTSAFSLLAIVRCFSTLFKEKTSLAHDISLRRTGRPAYSVISRQRQVGRLLGVQPIPRSPRQFK